MLDNRSVAALLEELADLLEISGANPFRVRAYRNAARTLETSADSVSALAAEGIDRLTTLAGIGRDLAEKIAIAVSSGTFPQLEEARQAVPAGVRELLRIPGLGPKKAAVLFRELSIQTIADVKSAAENGQIALLKGFGAKTEQLILQGIEGLAKQGGRRVISQARAAVEMIAGDLQKSGLADRVAVAGSSRRRSETVGDLDVVASSSNPPAVMEFLSKHPAVEEVLARGETKQRVRLRSAFELDLRVVPTESFGAALQYFTGSKEHNIVVRRLAQEQGLKVNEYGVFRGDERIAGATEADVYAAIGLPYFDPELREGRREFELAALGPLPRLITVSDVRGDLHLHTTATDGTASIVEMARAAQERGLQYIAVTDHSQRVSMANGLDATRLRAHWNEIRRVRDEIPGIEVLCGIECDILEDARLDLDDEVLAEADWVLAVLHYGLRQPREQIMERLLMAVKSPHVDAIGHPSGRLIGHRAGADIDYPTLLKACADYGTLLEINSNPERLDLDDIQTAAAKELGIPIVINTDAHSTTGYRVLEYGIDQARRAGLTPADVANTRPWSELKRLLKS